MSSQGVTEGYNGTIFAYGQTGSGKSFIMQGLPDPACQRGIIPRAFEHVFESVQVMGLADGGGGAGHPRRYRERPRALLTQDVGYGQSPPSRGPDRQRQALVSEAVMGELKAEKILPTSSMFFSCHFWNFNISCDISRGYGGPECWPETWRK